MLGAVWCLLYLKLFSPHVDPYLSWLPISDVFLFGMLPVLVLVVYSKKWIGDNH